MRSRLLASVLALVAVAGCGPTDQDDLDYNDADQLAAQSGGKADSIDTTSTFYTIEPDLRRCASPYCGGYWLKRVNRPSTKCADGNYSDRCYVAGADFSATGVDPSTLELGRVLVRATIALADFPPATTQLGKATVTEAWGAPTDITATGSYYRLTSSGIVCITTPCPVIHRAKLNSTSSTDVNGADLSASGATQAEIDAAMTELMATGILAAGKNVNGNFKASQYYTRLKAAPAKTCKKTGCSSQLCSDQDVITTCDWKPEYACYATATCEVQADGNCGWTMSDALKACLNPPPPVSNDVDLGYLSKPGPALTGTTQNIQAGAALKFRIDRNQIRGIVGFDVTPAGVLEYTETVIDPGTGAPGATQRIELSLKVPAGTAVGTSFAVKTQTPPPSAMDPIWAFSFTILSK
jgi:hypothetical protein